ncbi:MAG: PD-(D/E)XK nuclease family protein [Deltaproteobacteria bacterium]|nr:PD-(D/E)XK nuclease family protein [Deltaproteobacteria bacterium]
MISPRFFSTSAALQDFILQEAGLGALVIVPHQRLAQQLRLRQRQAQLQAGRAAWEPLAIKTFQGWLQDLFTSLWPEVAIAPDLHRWSLMLRAMQAAPELPGAAAGLDYAQALDDAYSILCRHSLLRAGQASVPAIPGESSLLITWRNQVFQIYRRLLTEGGWLAPGELPAYLLERLHSSKLNLPGRLLVAGLESSAPAEAAFLEACARSTRVLQLQVKGDSQAVTAAMVLPDLNQEVAWVAARLVESAASEGFPLHMLAVTSPDMEHYGPLLQRVLAELLGPAQAENGWAYNFSQGPKLAETPLFLAAVLPLRFVAAGERREDLLSFLLSPFYADLGTRSMQTAPWDRLWREGRIGQGWTRLQNAIAHNPGARGKELLPRLHRLWETLKTPGSPRQWRERLEQAWQVFGFGPRDASESSAWIRLSAVLLELEAALGNESLEAGGLLAWLEQGAKPLPLPGPGVQDAGLQVLGLLEMRGLDFSRVFCLGMNSGALPPPPRALPLLTAAERRLVLGGTYRSQHEFSRDLYDTLLGAAPELILSRPEVADDEERVGSPLYLGPWQPQEMAVLNQPPRAWLRSPAIRAASSVTGPAFGGYGDGPLSLSLAPEYSLSQAATALGCPCRFMLEFLLKLKELPEIESGLDPRERGDRLHKVLADFTREFNKFLEENGWDHDRAQEILQTTAHQVLADLLDDLHWRAELDRWLGKSADSRSLLREWLALEQQRHAQGWRWQLMEAGFAGLKEEGWPFALKGRLDRLDFHPENRQAVVWDYKSGKVPKAVEVFDELQEVQLACYLLAVERGLTGAFPTHKNLRAGYIGLKSPRKEHLKHEEFAKRAPEWPRVAAALVERLTELGRRLSAGDYRPSPFPAPEGKKLGACQYCPYALLCGFAPAVGPEDGDGESD